MPTVACCVCYSITQEIRKGQKNSGDRAVKGEAHIAAVWELEGFQKTLVLPFSEGLCEHAIAK